MTLNELNFKNIIQLDIEDPNTYSFDEYVKNNNHHPNITGFCTLCEEKGINSGKTPGYYLQNISHGSRSIDFLKSFNEKIDLSDWNTSGVMFVMESPSKDYGIYKTVSFKKDEALFTKRPSDQWYWIHEKQNIARFPKYFKGGEYGKFVASAILTFKLANAYMTNLIKCGMNGENDTFKGIDDYDEQCIKTCCKHFLEQEIDLLQPRVIFTFGSKVFYWVNTLFNDRTKVVSLPHPAGQRRGFKDEYYKTLYFCLIAKALYQEGVIEEEFYSELMITFAEKNIK